MSRETWPKEKILIVDDEPFILRLAMDALSEGYTVRGTSSSLEALEILLGERFELLLTDVVMPEIDGLVLLRRAREIDPDITAVIMTGYGTVDVAIESLKTGAQSFLVKPFSVQELRAAIEEALEKSRLVKENVRLKAIMPLFEVNRALISEVELEKLFNLIVQAAALATDAERASLMLLDTDTQELAITAEVGSPGRTVSTPREKVGKGIAGWVTKTGKPLILGENAKVSRRWKEVLRQTGDVSALCVPLRVKNKVIGVLTSSRAMRERPFTRSDLEALSILAGQSAIVIENANLFRSVQAQQIRLEQLLSQLFNAQEDERRRLSAEIHDGVAQLMISASYHAQSCSALLSKSRLDEASDEIGYITSTIERSIKELRRIIADLHPPALSELGLEQALRENVDALEKEMGIACHFRAQGAAPDGLSLGLEIAIYRMVQEALSNVRKHACATEVNVGLRFHPDEVLVEVRDNGKGFDLSRAIKDGILLGHMGLVTMKERAEMLGGDFKIETGQGAGTRVILAIPLSPKSGCV